MVKIGLMEVSFMMLIMCLSFSCAMDLTSEQCVKRYFTDILPKAKMSDMGHYCDAVPIECRGKLLLHMHQDLLMLHRVALCLPQEIQKYVVSYIFADNIVDQNKIELAAEKFLKKPIIKAFVLYQEIKNSIREHESVVPLFIMSKTKRNDFFHKMHAWYSNVLDPIITIQEQQKIYALDADEQQYFIGKEVTRISDKPTGPVSRHDCGMCLFYSCCAGTSCCAGATGITCAAGGTKLFCNPCVMLSLFGVSYGSMALLCGFGCGGGVLRILNNMEKVIL